MASLDRPVIDATATVRNPRRFPSRPFPPRTDARLRAALARAHAQWPFTPREVREAARRVRHVAEELDLVATVVRGGLDVGGAELDHVWVDVDGRVVDVTLPVSATSFLAVLRAYVAGDCTGDELERAAHGYALDRRVLGSFPTSLRYVGQPVWSSRRPGGRD